MAFIGEIGVRYELGGAKECHVCGNDACSTITIGAVIQASLCAYCARNVAKMLIDFLPLAEPRKAELASPALPEKP